MKKQIETERKYIIEMPDIDALRKMKDYTESEITQIYLIDDMGKTHRIRKREYKDKTVFYENIKTRISAMSVIEEEGEISDSRYLDLSKKIDPRSAPVYKKSITFAYGAHTLEIDIYPEWKKTAILEAELGSEDEIPDFPPEIKIILEVTGDKCYSNHSMSFGFPAEIL